MKSRASGIAAILVSALGCLSTACTTMRPVTTDPTGNQIRTGLRAGDQVRVVRTDGDTLDLKVSALGSSSLSGELVRPGRTGQAAGSHIDLPYQDIEQLAVRRLDLGHAACLVLLAVGAATLTVVAVAGPALVWH